MTPDVLADDPAKVAGILRNQLGHDIRFLVLGNKLVQKEFKSKKMYAVDERV